MNSRQMAGTGGRGGAQKKVDNAGGTRRAVTDGSKKDVVLAKSPRTPGSRVYTGRVVRRQR